MNPIRLGLFMTRDGSLQTWQRVGGLERELAIYRELAKQRIETTIFSYDDDPQFWSKEIGMKVVAIRSKWLTSSLSWLHRRGSAWQELKQVLGCVDIIKTNQFSGGWEALAAARMAGVPLVARSGFLPSLTSRRDGRSDSGLQDLDREEADLVKASQSVVITAQHLKDYLVDRYPDAAEKIHVIGNYIPDYFMVEGTKAETKPDCFRVLTVGRHHKHKGYDVLMDALSGMQNVEWTCIGAGQDTDFEGDKSKAETLGLHYDFIRSLPNQDLPAMYRSADAFVLSSRHEGHPKSIVEAMACGCAVVASDCPGVAQDVQHEKTGLVVPLQAEELRQALQSLQQDQELRNRLGVQAAEAIRSRYNINTIAELEGKLYRRVLREKV